MAQGKIYYAATLLYFAEQQKNVTPQIPGSMTAAELSCEVLDRRKIPVKDKEYWSCWEVSDKEEMGESDWETKRGGTAVGQSVTLLVLLILIQMMIFFLVS